MVLVLSFEVCEYLCRNLPSRGYGCASMTQLYTRRWASEMCNLHMQENMLFLSQSVLKCYVDLLYRMPTVFTVVLVGSTVLIIQTFVW